MIRVFGANSHSSAIFNGADNTVGGAKFPFLAYHGQSGPVKVLMEKGIKCFKEIEVKDVSKNPAKKSFGDSTRSF